jgi:hypothetical protein
LSSQASGRVGKGVSDEAGRSLALAVVWRFVYTASVVQVRDAEAWTLVDERLHEFRRLPCAQLRERVGDDAETEELDGTSGHFRRRTRVIVLYRDRLGIKVKVDAGGRRALAEGQIIITSEGVLAPEWSMAEEGPPRNPFVFSPVVMLVGLALAVLLLLVFFLFT